MRILIINPNTTASMTEKIGKAGADVALKETEITALNPLAGPSSIQGPEDGELALPGLFQLFEREVLEKKAYDLAIVACFDDTGLMELKRRSSIPVLGIGEAAFHAAMFVGERFSVVTTLSVSVPVIEENLRSYGFADRCAKVRASEVPVLDLEKDDEAISNKIASEIRKALDQDNVGSIVLGCAGMADMASRLSERFGVPVIDGVAAAVTFGEALYRSIIGNKLAMTKR